MSFRRSTKAARRSGIPKILATHSETLLETAATRHIARPNRMC